MKGVGGRSADARGAAALGLFVASSASAVNI